MRKLVSMVSHPNLIQEIVGQFVFMMMMSKPEDGNFEALHSLDLNDIAKKADTFFIEFAEIEELIMADECNLTEKITEFLKEWQHITDVTAIQQNIHYRLLIMDKEFVNN